MTSWRLILTYEPTQAAQDFSDRGTRQRAATTDTVMPFFLEIRERFPTKGARAMVSLLRQDYGIKVSEKFLNQFFKDVEPEALRNRVAKKFKRKRFWSAGVMDMICFDQHDKWKRFGLWPHLGLDPYAGRILWLNIWWTNRNPKLITSYYINACRRVGGVPLISQSDAGSENYGVANCQTVIRQQLDPSLEGTLQHRWMSKDGLNVKPEAGWSYWRRWFTPAFETILDQGVHEGLYNVENPLENLVFRWLAIPWLQREIDAFVRRFNSTPRRRDKNKILPQGIPDLITAKPHLYGTEDYKVIVSPALFDEIEQQWAPPDDPVFVLTPPVFTQKVEAVYEALDRPEVTHRTFWNVYCAILDRIVQVDEDLTMGWDEAQEAPIELIPGQEELRQGGNPVAGYTYLGGLAVPPPLADDDEQSESEPQHFADLTDAESS
ncbi:hypothetical protein R3P38DRAFT_2512612 [Favolaschia claudopus]|uniref:Integrase core domain-containing protein n=1 Tax=Favolaschia claudopus TaxID=2862362 RepID=A0AAW0CTL1_9AGAR